MSYSNFCIGKRRLLLGNLNSFLTGKFYVCKGAATGPLVRNLKSYMTRMMRIKLSRATNCYLHAAYYFRLSSECWTTEVQYQPVSTVMFCHYHYIVAFTELLGPLVIQI